MQFNEANEAEEFYVQALMLSEVVSRILKARGEIILSAKPTLTLRPIVQFAKRMRIAGLEKYGEHTFISTINFYKTQKDLENGNAVGAIILYLAESHIEKFLKKLEYPDIDDDDEEILEDACGSFCNLIGGKFRTGLSQLGYKDLIMSHFSTYQNEIVNGVPFEHDQKEYYEINFEIGGEKRLVVDYTMGYIPNKKKIDTGYFEKE